jgi:hypothetical protein
MQTPDYQEFFQAYVGFYNAALEEKPILDNLRHCYAEYLVSASGTQVMGGENSAEYGKVLERGFGFYRAIGVTRMLLCGVDVSAIIPDHDLAKVHFRAEMRRKDGVPLTLDFDVTYFLQRRDSGPKIFAFVSEDEMALFREHGLVDKDGKPV